MNSVFVCWPASKDHWPLIEERIAAGFEVVARREIELQSEAMLRALLFDIYMGAPGALEPRNRDRIAPKMAKKAEALFALGNRVLAIGAHYQGAFPGAAVTGLKERLRSELPEVNHHAFGYAKKFKFNLHGSDGEEEAARLAEILFSDLNLKHLALRQCAQPAALFLDRLAALSRWCERAGVGRREFCIVSGGVLEACGYRAARDLDLLCRDDLRDRIKAVAVAAPPDAFQVARVRRYHPVMTNNELIERGTFTMLGFRFAALKAVMEAKAVRNREKDRADLDLIAARNAA